MLEHRPPAVNSCRLVPPVAPHQHTDNLSSEGSPEQTIIGRACKRSSNPYVTQFRAGRSVPDRPFTMRASAHCKRLQWELIALPY